MRRHPTTLAFLLLSFWLLAEGAQSQELRSARGARAAEAASGETGDRAQLMREILGELDALEQHNRLLKKVVRYVRPTVVHIEAHKTEPSPRPGRRPVEEAGSGVIVQIKGKHYVLTNRHLIKSAALAQVRIKLDDGRVITPINAWADESTDVAVLGINADNLIAAEMGDSDSVEIGDFVLAVGSPFGLNHSVTFGIISAKGRRDLELGGEGVRIQDFLQTDAAINPGNSGGPLLNLKGEVIGINTAIASASGGNEGIGFSIPIKLVRFVATQLIEHGELAQAYLGVKLDADFTVDKAHTLGLSRPGGAHVTGVFGNSPAAQARLQTDDVILKFGDIKIEDDGHLINTVSMTPIGEEIDVIFYRDGKAYSVKVKLGDRNALRSQ